MFSINSHSNHSLLWTIRGKYVVLCIALTTLFTFIHRGPHWVKAIMCLRQEGKLCRVPSKVIDTKYHKEQTYVMLQEMKYIHSGAKCLHRVWSV